MLLEKGEAFASENILSRLSIFSWNTFCCFIVYEVERSSNPGLDGKFGTAEVGSRSIL